MADLEPIFLPLIEPPADDGADRRYIHVAANGVWIGDAPADPTWPRHFLGRLGAAAVWGVDVPVDHDASLPAVTDLYTYFGESTESEWLAAGRAVQIVEWARTHRFCGRCATPTQPSPGERALRCPRCGLSNYPRLAPAMIVLVTRGEGRAREALLAQGVRMRAVMYSCLAGFVEPGESLEGAVQREVREEVSIEVGNIRYWGSQPWPFPHSLMVGFHAEWASGEIVCDPSEIIDAQWFRRDALPPRPHRRSIASALIDDWLTHPEW